MGKITCVETLKETSYVLSKTGLLITEKIRVLDILKIIFNFTYIILVEMIIVFNMKLAIKTNNMAFMNWMICILIPVLSYTAKAATLIINRKCILSLLDDINSNTFNEHGEDLNHHIRLIKVTSSLMLRYFGFAEVILIFVTCILPFIINMKLMIPSPFDTGKFEVLYKLFHLCTVIYFAANAVCFNIFYLTLMGLVIAQLNILADQLVNIWENSKSIQTRAPSYENLTTITARILKKSFVQHQMIISFVEKLSILGSLPLFVQYTSGCFTICNTIARLTIMKQMDISSVINSISYSSVIFTEMAAYHWIANEIMHRSDKIIESCYLSVWYELSVDSQKSLLPLMERARKPLVIKLYNFIDISLASLGVVVRWSYSLFALIRARYS